MLARLLFAMSGSGKSTLFRLILGEAFVDAGDVLIEESLRIGHIRQHLKADNPDETLLEYALRGIPGLAEMEHEIHALEHRWFPEVVETCITRGVLHLKTQHAAQTL